MPRCPTQNSKTEDILGEVGERVQPSFSAQLVRLVLCAQVALQFETRVMKPEHKGVVADGKPSLADSFEVVRRADKSDRVGPELSVD